MAMATKKATGIVARLMATATKRVGARARAGRGLATVTWVAGNTKGDG